MGGDERGQKRTQQPVEIGGKTGNMDNTVEKNTCKYV